METILLGLLIVSTLTGLTTEAIKKLLTEYSISYKANTLAGIVACVLSVAVGLWYTVLNGIPMDKTTIIYIVCLVFLSWLCAMVGYDKVIQTISQFKTGGKTE